MIGRYMQMCHVCPFLFTRVTLNLIKRQATTSFQSLISARGLESSSSGPAKYCSASSPAPELLLDSMSMGGPCGSPSTLAQQLPALGGWAALLTALPAPLTASWNDSSASSSQDLLEFSHWHGTSWPAPHESC